MKRKDDKIHDHPHLETERGIKISKAEYHLLKQLLPWLGFAFAKKSLITDFVVPTKGDTTRRGRIENVQKSANGETGLHCLRTFKNHPIKGKTGKHVRGEDEKEISAEKVLLFIMRHIDKLGAPIPYYAKKRWHFEGDYKGYTVTIALDHAHGLGKYSGYYMEVETILPEKTKRKKVRRALKAIVRLLKRLVGEHRRSKISYRRMLLSTWVQARKASSKKKVKKGARKAKKNYRKLLKKVTAAEGSLDQAEAQSNS